ncbi:hypothetical protein [Delftia acidovorans]|uniref:Uncharacterized protein n=1 Tax=Delftia acidovorans TaxID=80866 RepID=A0AAJ2R9H6_DELAC|nr:hypothetical protein [Delftia acidovorans]MDX4958015.1 hypothetical protein [Delftia acidovorans]SOE37536.1 hypothetical protein SAMN05216519_3585 [Delftia acidovorans]
MTQHTCGSNGCSHDSDCAVHNEPAMPAGPCDCSRKAVKVLGEVLSVVQHYLPPDGGTVHEAMDKIIGLVDPWPLSNRPAGA